jgi:hypothetical protein
VWVMGVGLGGGVAWVGWGGWGYYTVVQCMYFHTVSCQPEKMAQRGHFAYKYIVYRSHGRIIS